ncbi:MAG TPA: hypothetical protein VLB44_03890 [Kofleriaceae bacterium]|nr:hypothetical protein [Kofleriaceae bacterium]
MCCFSVPTPTSFWQRLFAPKIHVSATNIFARMAAPGVQALAYGMNLTSAREVAMILPLPVRPNAGESAVRFIDLQKHPRLFEDLASLFDIGPPQAKAHLYRFAGAKPTLTVHKVGSFIASYVPTRGDFDRLDPRFRLPSVLFDAVPAYAAYGFAVFQLEKGSVTVHPMALTFPTSEIERLFFPTVHLHDGRFHPSAQFDHTLYYQHPRVRQQGGTFEGDVSSYLMPQSGYEGVVDKARPVLRRTLTGTLPNQDTWLTTGRPITVSPSRP